MAQIYSVSLQDSEKALIDWIKKMRDKNEISCSNVFREAMLQKKKEWEMINLEDTLILHQQIDSLRQTIRTTTHFFEENPEIQEKWFNFQEPGEAKSPIKRLVKT